MEFKISSIKIECDKGNILIPFSEHISFFYGNTSVGKTTLLNLINYAFGQSLIRTQAIENEVRCVCIDAYICGQRMIIERNVPSNLITVKKDGGEMHFSAKNNQVGKNGFSDYLYQLAGIASLDYIIGRKTANGAKLSFANYMWYSFLKQDELDNCFFYLEDNNIKKYASNYVLRSIVFETTNSDLRKQKELQSLKAKREENRERLLTVKKLFSKSNIFSINIGEEIAKKRIKIENLKKRLSILTYPDNLKKENVVEELLDASRNIGRYEAEILYLHEFYKVKELQREYENIDRDYSNKILRLEKEEKNSSRSSDELLIGLQREFKKCLLEVGFPGLSEDDIVKIDKESMIPFIYSCNNEFRFTYLTLSSGGVRSIFKICYALSIHILITKNNIKTLLPSFIMIDTPMKNISERNDRYIYLKLYDYLYKLFSENGELCETQLILVDKEESSVFANHGIVGKMFTRDHPLIPQ